MLIKVCGMRSPKQVQQIADTADFIGFIFYEKSKRFVQSSPELKNARKVGVFVNASRDEINKRIVEHSLDVVQLHGNETPEICAELSERTRVIKAFGINEQFDFERTKSYEEHVDFFLFDTKTPMHGGSGKQYDWSVLSNYTGSTPFFLSGGIRPDSMNDIESLQHSQFRGIDINSGFEHSPGDKDIDAVKQFIQELKNLS